MIDRAEVLAFARDAIGTPWVHQAAQLGIGFDCICLVAWAAAEAGSNDGVRFLADPAYRRYGPNSQPEKLYAACHEFMGEIPLAEALPADVYLMKFEGEPQHFGFLSHIPNRDPMLIHTWAMRGKVCEHEIDFKWRRRIIGAWRLRGIGPWPA